MTKKCQDYWKEYTKSARKLMANEKGKKHRLGIGLQQSLESETFYLDLFYGGFISGGETSSDSINTSAELAFLLEQNNWKPTGLEFDTDNVFGGFNLSDGLMIGGRTPSMDTLFGLSEGSLPNHLAASYSVDLSKGLWNAESTISIYPTDVTTQSEHFEGEVMAGYYMKFSPAKNVASVAPYIVIAGATYLFGPSILNGATKLVPALAAP